MADEEPRVLGRVLAHRTLVHEELEEVIGGHRIGGYGSDSFCNPSAGGGGIMWEVDDCAAE